MGMLQRANITLYPVLIRTVTLKGDILAIQHAAHDLAAATGGASFNDAADLDTAMKTAEEDSFSAYTLGYYPAEEVLDGKYHRLAVTLAGGKSGNLEVRYRPGYVATRQAPSLAAPSESAAINQFLENPLDATALGLTARFEPDPGKPNAHRVRLTVDLHDVHLERQGVHSVGALQLAFQFGSQVRTGAVQIDLTDSQLSNALKTGFVTTLSGIDTPGDSIRVLVRDPSTGAAGSLKIPVR
jgi:hypothetical protein